MKCFAATQCFEDLDKFIDDDEPNPKRMKQEAVDEKDCDDQPVVAPSDFCVNMIVAELNTGGTAE